MSLTTSERVEFILLETYFLSKIQTSVMYGQFYHKNGISWEEAYNLHFVRVSNAFLRSKNIAPVTFPSFILCNMISYIN